MEQNKESTTNNEIEIKIENVSMVYDDSKGNANEALRNISCEIHKGEFVSLLGPSGCGKSTLMRILADLIQPTSGKVTICGDTPEKARKSMKYGMVFQSPVLYSWRTIRQNIALPLEIMHYSSVEKKSIEDRMLELVGLQDFADQYPHQLSGGMQQRVGIARALAIQPEILFMDEPFSALDELTKDKLHEDLLRIWRRTGKTIIFVTHNIEEATYLSDRVMILSPHPGRLSAEIDINLPRPRKKEMKTTREFFNLVTKIRESFEGGSI